MRARLFSLGSTQTLPLMLTQRLRRTLLTLLLTGPPLQPLLLPTPRSKVFLMGVTTDKQWLTLLLSAFIMKTRRKYRMEWMDLITLLSILLSLLGVYTLLNNRLTQQHPQ